MTRCVSRPGLHRVEYSQRRNTKRWKEKKKDKDRQRRRDGLIQMAWLQRSTSVHHLFGSRLERHATSNTVADYSVQFSTVFSPHPSPLQQAPPLPPPPFVHAASFLVLVAYPCQSCQQALGFYLTSPPLPPDFFIKRQPFTQIQEKQCGGGMHERN